VKTLFLAWQDPDTRCWFPVGRLTFCEQVYQFVYTQSAEEAQKQCGFQPLKTFPDLHQGYESDELFPLFANRLPPRSRPDYGQFVEWLNIPANEDDPIAMLARSGGRRVTDFFEVFPCPEPDEGGAYHVHFFAHGLRHFSKDSIDRIERMRQGEHLLLVFDFQNPHDPQAMMLRTNGSVPGDRYLVGYFPRYLLHDTFEILQECAFLPEVHVERVNPPPAPLQLRLLCNMTACWPEGFRPCSGPEYQPLAPAHAT